MSLPSTILWVNLLVWGGILHMFGEDSLWLWYVHSLEKPRQTVAGVRLIDYLCTTRNDKSYDPCNAFCRETATCGGGKNKFTT